MSRKFVEKKLLIASGNEGKVKEIQELLKGFEVEVVSAKSLNVEEPEENGSSFIENAKIKSEYYCKKSGLPALADDSGLEVDALGGSPGIYSARWAGKEKDFASAMDKVRESLQDIGYDPRVMGPKHNLLKANFTCALSLTWPDGHTETFEGKVFGHLSFPRKGDKGFGYDPIFTAKGHDRTFAEIDPQEKHSISHRANAFNKLVRACFKPDDTVEAA